MAHVFNQTLVRDQIYGAWAKVLLKEDKYVLKIYSPHHDLSEYKDLIGGYMKAGKMALSISSLVVSNMNLTSSIFIFLITIQKLSQNNLRLKLSTIFNYGKTSSSY